MKKAFTLVEILVVITIIAIILVLTFPAYDTIQARARLQNSADTIAETIKQARTLSTSGYQDRKDSGVAVIGVTFEKDNNTVLLFSSKLGNNDTSEPTSISNPTTISTYTLSDVGVTELLVNGTQDVSKVSVLFTPPFGSAAIQADGGGTSFSRLTVRVGAGRNADSGLSKTIDFFGATNRIEYAYKENAAQK